MPPFKGSHSLKPEEQDILSQKTKELVLEMLHKKLAFVRSVIEKKTPLVQIMKKEGKYVSDALAQTFYSDECPHPISWVFSDLEEQIDLLEADIDAMDDKDEIDDTVVDIKFLPIP